MKEYIEREALLKYKRYISLDRYEIECVVDVDKIIEAPAVDIVKVVYCKDCLYSQKVDDREPMYECNHICRMGCTQWLGSDDYCSYGERK